MSSRIMFFAPDGNIARDGVLRSQFLAMASFLQRSGHRCLIVATCGESEAPSSVAQSIRLDFGLSALVYRAPAGGRRPLQKRLLPYEVLRAFSGDIRRFLPTHAYTRTPRALIAAKRHLSEAGVKCVYDARGAMTAEVELLYGSKWNHHYVETRFLERRALRTADLVSCVSSRMDRYLTSVAQRSADTVIPCCVSEIHDGTGSEETRRRLGFLGDDRVYCYVGGVSKWQRTNDIVRLFKALADRLPAARFLFVSAHAGDLRALCIEASLDLTRCQFISCLQSEVAQYISAADVGVIMRDDVLVNNVASPIKIGEYLAAGVPVILTPGIGDFSTDLPQRGLGVLIENGDDPVDRIIAFTKGLRKSPITAKCYAYVQDTLSWKAYTTQFEKLYGPLESVPC